MPYPTPHNEPDAILRYLQQQLPDYPYDDLVDTAFVNELLDDFPSVNVLEEIKAFRWYHDNRPADSVSNLRLATRRWIVKGNAMTRSWP